MTSTMRAICSVAGCDGLVVARGWCKRHYDRWKRNGDPGGPEVLRRPRIGVCSVGGCGRRIHAVGLCAAHRRRFVELGDVLADVPIRRVGVPLSERFWSRVDRRGSDECWPWTGKARHRFGYGKLGVNGKAVEAHRVALMLTGVEIDGWQVLHSCDNPPCCNPAHLFLGTHEDNHADKLMKGRQPTGERHGHARFKDAEVAEFHLLRAAGLTYKAIGERFGCSAGSVWSATHRKRHSDETGHRRLELIAGREDPT